MPRDRFSKDIEGHAFILKSCFYHRRGPSKSNRFQYGTWFFSVLPETTTETKVSDKEESSTMDDSKDLEESSLGKDINNINDHGSTVEDLLPSLDAVVVDAAERVAETVEVAVQTVSSVGEIEGPIPAEQDVKDEATAVKTVVFWVCTAICFGLIIGLKEGTGKASEFFTGYIVEQSLSVDNLVVFVVIFKYFCVPTPNQSRVLAYGISGAIVFRATMILLGAATIKRFEAVNLLFASILIFSSYKLLTGEEEDKEDLSENYIVNICRRFIPVTAEYDGNKFFTKMEGPQKATPLLLTLAVVELSDIVFAVDSIPAVFGVTRDPLIVFSSNIFAILGLRSLYTLISSRMDELDYLQPAVAVVLGFIGSKMIADFFGFHTSVELSLGVVISVLGIGVGLSLWKNKQDNLN